MKKKGERKELFELFFEKIRSVPRGWVEPGGFEKFWKLRKIPIDGVLIESMKHGVLDCAGRASISSCLMTDLGIKNSIVWGFEHSFVIAEQNKDTLVYFDPNMNVLFSFPKEKLVGFKGFNKSAECNLQPFFLTSSNIIKLPFYGEVSVWPKFIVLPALEGISRQYFSNVTAALNGNKEFKKSGIKKNPSLIPAILSIEKEVLGKNEVVNKFIENATDYKRIGLNEIIKLDRLNKEV